MKFYSIEPGNMLISLNASAILASFENGETLELCDDGGPEGTVPALSVWGGRRPRSNWGDAEGKLPRQLCMKLLAANNIALWPAARHKQEHVPEAPARFYGTNSDGMLIDINASFVLIVLDNGQTLELTLCAGVRDQLPSLSIWGGRRPLPDWSIEDRKRALPLSLTSLAGNNCIIWPHNLAC